MSAFSVAAPAEGPLSAGAAPPRRRRLGGGRLSGPALCRAMGSQREKIFQERAAEKTCSSPHMQRHGLAQNLLHVGPRPRRLAPSHSPPCRLQAEKAFLLRNTNLENRMHDTSGVC